MLSLAANTTVGLSGHTRFLIPIAPGGARAFVGAGLGLYRHSINIGSSSIASETNAGIDLAAGAEYDVSDEYRVFGEIRTSLGLEWDSREIGDRSGEAFYLDSVVWVLLQQGEIQRTRERAGEVGGYQGRCSR